MFKSNPPLKLSATVHSFMHMHAYLYVDMCV